MKYGLQMYSIRDVAEKDLEAAVRTAAALGYSFLEYAGFFGHPAEEVASWQRKYNVFCSGTHSSWTDLYPDRIEKTVAYHKIIGNRNYIIPGADLSTPEKIDEFCRVLCEAQPYLASEGISLGYHNHSREFALRDDGRCVWDDLRESTPVDFEIDTFWAFNAGRDPVAMMEEMKDRVHVIHLKDGFIGGRGTALGEGEAPVRQVREKAIELGMTIVVESESLTPDGPGEVARCISFLHRLDKEGTN